jgi:hypothetical protein
LSVPGFAFDSAISSSTVYTPSFAFTTSVWMR